MSDTDQQVKKPPLVITSEAQFQTLMEEIDREMAREGTRITARPFKAGLKITERYDVMLFACPPRRSPKPGCFDPVEISIRIHDWIEARYGDRIDVDWDIGGVAFLFRGDLYRLRCPTIYGTVQFTCSPDEFDKTHESLGIDLPPICNALDLVEGFTSAMVRSLTAQEVMQVFGLMMLGMGTYTAVGAVEDVQLVREAKGDLDAAVFHLMTHQPQPGLSKWASLQAVEKLLKAYIAQQGKTPRRIHALSDLFDHAVSLGLPQPPGDLVSAVQCPAGVRYGEVSVTNEEAVSAHHAALIMCDELAQRTAQLLGKEVTAIGEVEIDGVPLRDFDAANHQ